MWVSDIICLFLGITFGFSAAAGLFALITSIKVVTRMADKTFTKAHITTYESAIMAGGTLWNAFYMLGNPLKNLTVTPAGTALLVVFGVFSGIYVGCIAMALAERLSVTAIFTRRIRLHTGISFAIEVMALGKLIGGLLYFKFGWSF